MSQRRRAVALPGEAPAVLRSYDCISTSYDS